MPPLLAGTCCCLADTGTTNEHPCFSLSLECHFTGNELSALAPGVLYLGSFLCISFFNSFAKTRKVFFSYLHSDDLLVPTLLMLLLLQVPPPLLLLLLPPLPLLTTVNKSMSNYCRNNMNTVTIDVTTISYYRRYLHRTI